MNSNDETASDKWIGVLLAGGTGSRLYPLTKTTNKHLLPVYDKPLIYYSLSSLMIAGIRDIVVVSDEVAKLSLNQLLGDGTKWGLNIQYRVQEHANGIADGLNCAGNLIKGKRVALVLGDNIFHGANLSKILTEAKNNNRGATIFGYPVQDASSFGVVNIDADGKPIELEEKPKIPKSNLAIPGMYFYNESLLNYTSSLTPSARGELEITDVNQAYLNKRTLNLQQLGRGIAWLDAGTPKDMFFASQYIQVIEERTGTKIGCPEEISWRQNWITSEQLKHQINDMKSCDYKSYLENLIE